MQVSKKKCPKCLHSESIPTPFVSVVFTTPRAKFAPWVSRVIQCVSDIVKWALRRLSPRLYVRCWAPPPSPRLWADLHKIFNKRSGALREPPLKKLDGFNNIARRDKFGAFPGRSPRARVIYPVGMAEWTITPSLLALAQDESVEKLTGTLLVAISSTPRWVWERERVQLKCKLGEKFSLTEQRARL